MNDYNNGKVWGWNGGECPVHPETVVKYWMYNGHSAEETTSKNMRWSHNGSEGDIIAFQVVKAYVEPKVIWVNEYADEDWYVYMNEGKAKIAAAAHSQAHRAQRHRRRARIAVKYVEVKDD